MANDIHDVEQIADLMDTKWRGPFGVRFGLDGILGFIPGLGDLVTNAFSGYIMMKAVQLGYPASVIARMFVNIILDNLLDAIPFLGNIFDIFFKANVRNVDLMRRYSADPTATRRRSGLWLLAAGLVLILVTAAMIALSVTVAVWVYNLIVSNIQGGAI